MGSSGDPDWDSTVPPSGYTEIHRNVPARRCSDAGNGVMQTGNIPLATPEILVINIVWLLRILANTSAPWRLA